jgi:serine/threonine protein kinase
MAQCPDCSESLPERARFCPGCGRSVLDMVSTVLAKPIGRPLPQRVLPPGTAISDAYTVEEVIGEGAMGVVYRGTDHVRQRRVAIKTLHGSLMGDASIRRRFAREARLSLRWSHPHVVAAYDFIEREDLVALVLELIDGPTLEQHLSRWSSALPLEELRPLFFGLLDAMGEAHRRGIVHRDLKPQNILLSMSDTGIQPKVTDFGIAKLLEAEGSGGKARTQAGARMGTLLYMSPEQIRGAGEVDARTDIFSLGAILYEAVTGRVAFHASSDYDTMKSIVEGTYEPPERVVGGLPPVIAGCIRKALAVDPAERFQDCAAFRDALEKALDADAQAPQKPSRSYAVTQLENPPARTPSAPPAGMTPESHPSAFAPTYVPGGGQSPKPAAPPSPPVPPAPAPSALAPTPSSSVQRAPVNTVRVSPRQVAQATPGAMSRSNVSPVVAVLLNLFCLSGGGQLYNGQTAKGVLGICASIFMLASISEGGAAGACFWLTCYFSFYVASMVDAYRIAARRQRGLHVGPWELF